jgi:hypothetical protein
MIRSMRTRQFGRNAAVVATLVMSLVAVAVAAPAAAGAVVPSAEGQASKQAMTQTTDRLWYWPRAYAEYALRYNGLTFSNAYDRVRGVQCTGLGKPHVSRGVPMFSAFHCLIVPEGGASYKIIFHAATDREYRIRFTRYQTKTDWVWPPQYAANRLVDVGIRWDNGRTDRILGSACGALGQSWNVRGTPQWALFYCVVIPASGTPYTVVLDVVDRVNFRVNYVSHAIQTPQTPTMTTPTPSRNTTNQKIANMQSQVIVTNAMMATHRHWNQMKHGQDTAPDPLSIMLLPHGQTRLRP